MKANELRIGNLMRDKLTGEWLYIIELREKSIGTKVINRGKFPLPDGWQMEPIPLTDDILMGCDFMDEFNLSGFEPDGYIAVINHSHIGNEMKYLHQLQNLYFALAGKEMWVNHD